MQVMPSYHVDYGAGVIGDVRASFTWRERVDLPEQMPIETLPSQLPNLQPDQQAETSVGQSVEKFISRLRDEAVHLGDVEGIRGYLMTFSGLIDVIPYAIRAIRKYLPQAHLCLDLYKDPEIEDEHLILYIRLAHYDKDVMNGIRRIREEYRPLCTGKDGWLFVTTDFRQPEE